MQKQARLLAVAVWLVSAALSCSDQRSADVYLSSINAGCAVDSDCSVDTYCDVTQSSCVPRRAAGELLPLDSLHDGSCTLQSGVRLCQSGACNAAKKTCANSNGASCSGAAVCVSDVCGQNQQCGIEEGGLCDSSSEQHCQTYRCSMPNDLGQARCIRQDSGCASDIDCHNNSYCDPAVSSCRPKLAAGSPLPQDSLHDGVCSAALAAHSCSNGLCNANHNTCAAMNGASCSHADECASDACGDNGRCGLALGEAGCTSQTQAFVCQSGHCAASGVCVPALGCDVDSDCSDGLFCNRSERVCVTQLRAGQTLPHDGLHNGVCSEQLARVACTSGQCNAVTNTCAAPTNAACTNHGQCITDVCADNGKCGERNGLGACTQDAQCQSGTCHTDSQRCVASEHGCTRDEDCVSEQYCNLTQLRCVTDLSDGTVLPADSSAGGKCTSDAARSVCASGLCNASNDTCAKAAGSECSEASECAADVCSDGVCGRPDGSAGTCTEDNAAGVCASRICQVELSRCVAAESGCSSDSDCPSSKYCDGRRLACVSTLPSGSKLPEDGLHASKCSDSEAVASAVCDTGACNGRANTCANVIDAPCRMSSDCASDACIDGQCAAGADAFSLGGGGCSLVAPRAGEPRAPVALLWLALLRRRRRQQAL